MTEEEFFTYADAHGYRVTAQEQAPEYRTDYSEGSDDQESDSARWRAEQRYRAMYDNDTQDLY